MQSRSDYTAFGEQIGADTGLRTAAQGYGKSGGLRQAYALTEKDDATGLDHTWFRKNENRAGRWTSPDPYNGSMSLGNPQSFNRYSYVENQPTNFVDPTGLIEGPPRAGCVYNNERERWDCPPLEIPTGGGGTWDDPDPTGGGESPGGGAGGPTPQPERDPCEGRKGTLDYDSRRRRADNNGKWTAREHITDNHVRKDINQDKSKYTNSLRPSIALDSAVFAWVTALNQLTFQSSVGFSSRGNVAYVYAVPKLEIDPPLGPKISIQVTVGTDSNNSGKYTNVNTLIVSSDCKTVITSHPGLPGGVNSGDSRITGNPIWVDRVPTTTITLRPWPF